eukprot:3004973-Prymnesium_polylepis.1
MGRLRWSALVVGYVPADVVAGFHACIGYKVIKAAVEVATGYPLKFQSKYLLANFGSWESSWRLLLPGLAVGLPLYYAKHKHIGNPRYLFPAFILAPLLVFYACLLGASHSIDDARDEGWFYTEVKIEQFWYHLLELYGSLFDGSSVAWDVLPECALTFSSMVLITLLDSLLMLTTTETALAIDIDYNYEMRVSGIATLLSSLLGGQPVYSQTKFSQINFSISHSLDAALPSYVCALLCGAFFFAPLQLFNVLPRFLLSGLLFFA